MWKRQKMEYKAGIDDDKRRLDRVIRKLLPNLPLSAVYGFLRKGSIRLNGKKVKNDMRICSGDILFVDDHITHEDVCIVPLNTSITLDILFKNEHILVINKPFDVSVHGSSDSLDKHVVRLYEAERNNKSKSLSFKSGPLHRLDRKTTGIIAFSQSLLGAQWFSEAIASHSIVKKYTGIVQGYMTEAQEWEEYLEKDTAQTGGFVTSKISVNGKKAQTHAKPVMQGITADGGAITLVEYTIITGRTHQIRLQSAHHGFPLWGDTAYNKHAPNVPNALNRFYLHAKDMHIPSDNPIGLPSHIKAPFPDDFKSVLLVYFNKSGLYYL